MSSSGRMSPAPSSCLLFFFQAEDGIRDADVTGVQTCALPISQVVEPAAQGDLPAIVLPGTLNRHEVSFRCFLDAHEASTFSYDPETIRESLGEIPRSRSLPRRSQGTLGMRPFSSRCGEQLLKLFKHASRALQCLRNRCRLE